MNKFSNILWSNYEYAADLYTEAIFEDNMGEEYLRIWNWMNALKLHVQSRLK